MLRRSITCHTPPVLRIRTYSPPPHNPPQKWSMYSSASVFLRFSPTCETTKYPKLFGNLASKSFVLVHKMSLGLTKTARAPLGRRKFALMFVENMLLRKKLVRVIRDDRANQASETELHRDFNDCPNQDSLSGPFPSTEQMRQAGLRRTIISMVRPHPTGPCRAGHLARKMPREPHPFLLVFASAQQQRAVPQRQAGDQFQ